MCQHAEAGDASTTTLNLPYAMRFMSNGMDLSSHSPFMRGSFMTLALTRSQ
jgi:hypothetical protein